MSDHIPPELAAKIAVNRPGWFALRHHEGWWVGTAKGVTCYRDMELARYALTIVWQCEGSRSIDYKIVPFTEDPVKANGEHTPKYSAIEAMNRCKAKS
jgi:hypothetical protein